MSSNDPSVTTWVGLLRAGDAAAAQPLWERYFARLVGVARHELVGTSKRAADEEDVALSAFHSFCRAVVAGRFPRLADRTDLWQVLTLLAARKAHQERRRQWADKRGGADTPDGRRVSEQAAVEPDDLAAPDPDPAFAALLREEADRLFARLPSDDLRRVAQLRLEGFTAPEIAGREGYSLRTVERKLSLVRGLWEGAADS